MRQAAFYLPLALLFLANVVPSIAQSESSAPEPASAGAAGAAGAAGTAGTTAPAAVPAAPAAAPAPQSTVIYNVGGNLSLWCHLAEGRRPVWSKNGTAVDQVWDLKGRYQLEDNDTVFKVSGRALEDDYGNYTCAAAGDAYTWQVRGQSHSKLPANSNVVEGQKLKLQCKVIGKPYPRPVWTYSNSTDEESEENGTDVRVVFGSRVQLRRSEQGIEDGELVLEPAQREDAGRFSCLVAEKRVNNARTVLRVKDMYAALWPFLGICAEVLVLCTIILVYEKRRTKPELDDSDTDNHEQKKS